MTLAKLSPLALLIVLGVAHFALQPQMIHASEIVSPGWSNWVRAVVLLMFPFAGWEESLIPVGEVREPRRRSSPTMPPQVLPERLTSSEPAKTVQEAYREDEAVSRLAAGRLNASDYHNRSPA
jgi:hypothetical protein